MCEVGFNPSEVSKSRRRRGSPSSCGRMAILPQLEGDPLRLRDLLTSEGLNPTSHMIRHTVVHELVDHVQERRRRKKRNTLRYVYSDIERRCRKTEAIVSPSHIRQIISAMKAAGILLHPNGEPVRSENAQFTIEKEAEDALVSLRGATPERLQLLFRW